MNKKLLFLIPSLIAGSANAVVVNNIKVSGNKRMDEESVRLMMPFKVGDTLKAGDLNESVKRIQETKMFSDVNVSESNGLVSVILKETPIIDKITIEGNDVVGTDELKKEIRSSERESYVESTVGGDIQRLLTVYQRQGYFDVNISPKLIKQPDNKVSIVFEIKEGEPTKIKTIKFTGNKVFSDSELRSVILSKPYAWWRFLSSFDVYDEDRIQYDQQLLRQHYLKSGYLDFKIKNSEGYFSNNRTNYYLNLSLDEGNRYKIGTIEIKNPYPDLELDELKNNLVIEEGDYYNIEKIDKSISKMREITSDKGYAFVNIDAIPDKNNDTRIVNIVFEIKKVPRMYINSVNYVGNVRTFDYVLEQEMRMQDKDAFSLQGVEQSRQRLMRTQFFKSVDMLPSRLEGTNLVNLDVKVSEQPTGELSGGIGWSNLNGFMLEAGITEKNFMGKGQIVSLKGTIAEYQSQAVFSFTEPYLFGRALSGGFDASYTDYRYGSLGSYGYDRQTIALVARLGWNLTEHWNQNLRYTVMFDHNKDTRFDYTQIARLYTISTGFKYYNLDTDFVQNTHTGLISSFNIGYTGFGGTEEYMKYDFSIIGLLNFFENRWQFKVDANAGYIDALDGDYVSRMYRYFLGGETLRGFELAGVGSRNWYYDNYAYGGLWKLNGSFQLNFPIFIPDEYQMKGFVFSDWGVLGNPPEINRTSTVGGITKDNYWGEELRITWGVGINWKTPMGPMSFSWGFPIKKQDYDKEQIFLLSFETQF